MIKKKSAKENHNISKRHSSQIFSYGLTCRVHVNVYLDYVSNLANIWYILKASQEKAFQMEICYIQQDPLQEQYILIFFPASDDALSFVCVAST